MDVDLEWRLPTLAWSARVRVTGLGADDARMASARWPAGAMREEPSIDVLLVHRDAPIGRADGPFVKTEARWIDEARCTLITERAELDVALSDRGASCRGAVGRLPVGAIEAAFRSIATLTLARRDVLVLHAAAIARDGEAVVVLGASGAGKTTTARRLGKEGFLRLADDMIAVDLATGSPALHPLPFERGGRPPPTLPARPPRLVAGILVAKAARAARVVASNDPVSAWTEGLVTLPPAPGRGGALLDALARLCAVPLGVLEAPPAGRLAPALNAWLDSLTPRSEPGGGPSVV